MFYNATRRMVLKGADCLVFVVDSQEPMLDASIESYENLRQNLEANEIDPDQIPMVLQYNKRDLPNALPIEILNERMNPNGFPFFEAVAVKGVGVEETLKGVTKLVFKSLSAKYGEPGAAPRSRRGAHGHEPGAGHASSRRGSAVGHHPAGGPAHRAREPGGAARRARSHAPGRPRGGAGPRGGGRASTAHARSTLVAEADEAEDLRRRITRPISEPDYEVNLEEVSLPEAMEEISLDSEPLTTFEPEGDGEEAEPTLAPSSLSEPEDLPPPEPARPAPAPVPYAPRSSEAAPLVIEVEAGRNDVTLPIELNIEPGVEQVSLNLRLVFNIRR